MRRWIPHQTEPTQAELNLAPIMNMVMNMVPLLLLSVVFTKVGVVDLSAVTHAQNDPPLDQEPVEPEAPSLVIHVSLDGYRTYDADRDAHVRSLAPADPTSSSDDTGPAICVEPGTDLVAQLNYSSLRDAMLLLREHPAWSEQLGARDTIVRVAADPEVPFDTLIATMDAIRKYPQGDADRDLFPNVAIPTPAPHS